MRDTLELKILRMPRLIEGSHLSDLQRNLEQWIQPQNGVMLDFTQTETTDPAIAHILLLGWDLAAERQGCLSWMGESGAIAAMLGDLGLTKPSHDPSLSHYQTSVLAPSQALIQSKIA
jgi:anti-anti-sigma regulatory factor